MAGPGRDWPPGRAAQRYGPRIAISTDPTRWRSRQCCQDLARDRCLGRSRAGGGPGAPGTAGQLPAGASNDLETNLKPGCCNIVKLTITNIIQTCTLRRDALHYQWRVGLGANGSRGPAAAGPGAQCRQRGQGARHWPNLRLAVWPRRPGAGAAARAGGGTGPGPPGLGLGYQQIQLLVTVPWLVHGGPSRGSGGAAAVRILQGGHDSDLDAPGWQPAAAAGGLGPGGPGRPAGGPSAAGGGQGGTAGGSIQDRQSHGDWAAEHWNDTDHQSCPGFDSDQGTLQY